MRNYIMYLKIIKIFVYFLILNYKVLFVKHINDIIIIYFFFIKIYTLDKSLNYSDITNIYSH